MKETYILKKIGKVDSPKHPNSEYGDSQEYFEGVVLVMPEVGERFNLHGKPSISTSPVTELLEEGKFKTLNSIYQLQKISE